MKNYQQNEWKKCQKNILWKRANITINGKDENVKIFSKKIEKKDGNFELSLKKFECDWKYKWYIDSNREVIDLETPTQNHKTTIRERKVHLTSTAVRNNAIINSFLS